MPRKLVISPSHLCDELAQGNIKPEELRDCLFFFSDSREKVAVQQDTPADLAGICTCLPPGTRQKVFDEIVAPLIAQAETENRCRWPEQYAKADSDTSYQECVEAFLMEHGYPRFLSDERVKDFLPYCSVGSTAVSFAIRTLGLEIEIC